MHRAAQTKPARECLNKPVMPAKAGIQRLHALEIKGTGLPLSLG